MVFSCQKLSQTWECDFKYFWNYWFLKIYLLNAKKDLVSENPSAVNMSNLFLKLIFRSYDYAISFTDICIKKYLDMLYAGNDVISEVLKN